MAVFLYGGELIFEKKSTYFWERPLVEITHIFSLSCVSFVYCYPLTTCLWNFLTDDSTLEKNFSVYETYLKFGQNQVRELSLTTRENPQKFTKNF